MGSLQAGHLGQPGAGGHAGLDEENFVWLHGYNPRVAESVLGGRHNLRRGEPAIGARVSGRGTQAQT